MQTIITKTTTFLMVLATLFVSSVTSPSNVLAWSGYDYSYDDSSSYSGYDYSSSNWGGYDYSYDSSDWSGSSYSYDSGNDWSGYDYSYDSSDWGGYSYDYGNDWSGYDYSYDSSDYSGYDYSYNSNDWSGYNYTYDDSDWSGVDYSYDAGDWSGYNYTYDSGNDWSGYDYSYDSSDWTGYNYTYDDGSDWSGYNYTYDDAGDWSGYNYTYDDDVWTGYNYTYDDDSVWSGYNYTYDSENEWSGYNYTYDDAGDWSGYNYTYDDDVWTGYNYTYDDTWSGYNYPYDTLDNVPFNPSQYTIRDEFIGDDGYDVVYDYEPYYIGGYEGGYIAYNGGCSGGSCGGCTSGNCGGGTTIINNYNNTYSGTSTTQSLNVLCVANDYYVQEGTTVQWSATVYGGNGTYTYDWSGTDGLDGSSRTESIRYTDRGSKTASVTVTSGGQTRTTNCGSVTVYEDDDDDDDNDDDLEVVCRVDDTSVEEGDTVTFRADVDGGNSPFEYDWSGDVDGEDRTETKRFSRDGRYSARVTVRDDDGNTATDSCDTVRVSDEDDDDNDDDDNDSDVNVSRRTVTTSNPPTGTPASLSSVYLSQVPYTGAAETVKFVGLTLLALATAFGVTVTILKKKAASERKSRIEHFKRENLARKTS